MKKHFNLLSFSVAVFCLLSMPSCLVTRIFTEAPVETKTVVVRETIQTPAPQPHPQPVPQPVVQPQTTTVYTTTVTTPNPKVTTVSTFVVTDYNTDPCFSLDLMAVAAAYAESRSVREFEQILNSSRYMINNLDLNNDGWIDYLRVIETRNGYYHALLIQSCLAPGIFQDIATLVAERRADALFVEVIGDRYLYGVNYVVRPVFIKRPHMWDVYGSATYVVWSSPYYYGNFPSYYTHPKPVYLNHYQAYVTTYMSNHHYCHHCDYPPQPYNNTYASMTKPHNRNDFGVQHPDNSFEHRVSRTANGNNNVASARNAGQLRTEVNRQAALRTQQTTQPTQNSQRTQTTTNTQRTQTGTTTQRTQTTTNAQRTTTTQSSSNTRTSQRTPNTTTVETRVNQNGTARTTVKTTDEAGRTQTVRRESTSNATRTTSTSTRSSQGSSSGSTPRSDRRGR